jgi:nucleotide-binding universal stress UspA family protein
MFHKILVAINNTEIGRHVFDEALYTAKTTGAEMMLLYVVSPFEEQYRYPAYVYPGSVYPYTFMAPNLNDEAMKEYVGEWEALKQEGIEFLTLLSNQATASGVKTQFTQNLGDPGQIICEMAGNWNADLIIIGRRGRSGLSEFFLGSVSSYVLHHAPCSVLTVQRRIKTNTQELQQVETTSA